MATKIFITLVGGDQVEGGIKKIGDSLQQLKGLSNPDLGLDKLNVQFRDAAQSSESLGSSSRSLVDGLHILRPVLQEIGVSVGSVREFSFLAREGIVGLAVAITGAATIGLVKFNDTLHQSQAIFGDFLGSQSRGAQAFDAVSAAAEKVGSSVESALPGIETLTQALQATGAVGGGISDSQIQKLTSAFDGLFTALRSGHASISEANSAWNSFAQALAQQGKLTDIVAQTLSKFPGALDLLKRAFNQGQLSNQAFINSLKQSPQTLQATISALQRIPALLPEAFDPSKPQLLTDALTLLLEAAKKGFASLSKEDVDNFVGAIVGAAPAVTQLAIALTKVGTITLEGVAGGISDLNREIENGQRFVSNYAAVWTQLKVLLLTPVDAQGTTAPIQAAFEKLLQMLHDIKETGFALPELDPKNKQDLKDATDEIDAAKTAFDDFSRQKFGAGQFVTIGVNVDTKPAQEGLTKFTEENVGKGKFITIDAKVDFPDGVPLPRPKPEELEKLQADVKASFEQLFNDLQGEAGGEGDKLAEALGKPIDFQSIIHSFDQAMSNLLQSAQNAFERYKQILTQPITIPTPQIGGGGGGAPNFFETAPGGAAAGGHIRGPGSSTSDSILAWLSNNEFVMKSAAVSHYGVDLMHAINSMRLPKDFFRGFNMGGLVMPAFPSAPRFAQGGLAVAGSRSLTLVLDGKSFNLSGQKSAVDQLERAADLHNLSRLGRAPGWVR